MSTSNFKPMRYGMPLIVGGIEDYDDLREAYEAENDDEYDEMMYQWDLQDMFDEAEREAEIFSETLKYHHIEIKSGYYYGFQFYVEEITEKEFDLFHGSEFTIDDDSAEYYFDTDAETAICEANAEKEKIIEWLESLTKCGYTELVTVGRFSNGETLYEIKNHRSELLAAVNE